jgi:hypothetical protein
VVAASVLGAAPVPPEACPAVVCPEGASLLYGPPPYSLSPLLLLSLQDDNINALPIASAPTKRNEPFLNNLQFNFIFLSV